MPSMRHVQNFVTHCAASPHRSLAPTPQTWYFECNKWFDAKEGDCKLERVLFPSLQNPRSQRTLYKVRVKTSDRSGAGTDANVYVDIRGDSASTGEFAPCKRAGCCATTACGKLGLNQACYRLSQYPASQVLAALVPHNWIA